MSRRSVSGFVLGAENFDLILDHVYDCSCARSEKLSRVEALALLILAGFDVLTCSLCESDLALCVDIDLGNAKVDSLLYHSIPA